jgi:hypothetical protein
MREKNTCGKKANPRQSGTYYKYITSVAKGPILTLLKRLKNEKGVRLQYPTLRLKEQY